MLQPFSRAAGIALAAALLVLSACRTAGEAPMAAAPPSAAPAATAPAPAAAPPAPATASPAPRAAAAEPAVPQYTIDQFLKTTNLRGGSFSPDASKILVSSDQTGVFNAFAVPVAGGEPVQLTRSEDTVAVEGYFPRDERFLYTSDRGGNELSHVYVRELDGSVRDLTPGDKLKAEVLDWSHDKRAFYVTTNERDERFFDLYRFAADGYERKLLFKNEEGYDVVAVSPDERYLALQKTTTTVDTDVVLRDLKTGTSKMLTAHTGEVANVAQAFSPDGAWLYATTDEGSEFARLVRYELASGRREEVLKPNWDVVAAAFSDDGRYFVVLINNDAKTEIRLFNAADMQPVALPRLPEADITGLSFSADSRLLAFYANPSRSPRNLYVHDLASGETRKLTSTLDPAVDEAALVDARVVRFRSYDGTVIPGLLYQPRQASARNPVPALVWVHGGPGDQSRIGYSALIQFLVNHGYAVYAINNRGSSGYGKTFFKMDDRKHGDADLDDCVSSKRMLAGTGWVDPDRIGILGGSYGGYMVLAALAYRPQEFVAGVDLFGVANWLRTLESIPPYWESFRQALYQELGDPVADKDYLMKISPLFHADKIERPLLVLQGANDPRVLQVESDEIVAAARKRGTPVEYIVFPDEGHGFVKKANQAKGYQAILEFLDKYLKGPGPAAAVGAG